MKERLRNRFREARQRCNLTQEEVAQRISVSRTTYIRYETGERECSFENLRKLSNIFNSPIDYLLLNDPSEENIRNGTSNYAMAGV